jgi:hypothetical protein
MCETETDGEKEKGVTKDHKGILIMENYKNAHNGYGHGVLWEKFIEG